jgi:protease I
MLLEAGCVAENVQLQAVALGLASVPVGAFETKEVARICQLSSSLEPILILSVGFPAGEESPEKTKSGALRAVLVVPGFNFTDEELFVTQRVLAEASIETVIASSKIGPLQGVLGGLAASEVTFDKLRVADFDAVIFVGGPGAAAYFTDSNALALAKQAAEKRKVIAAISFAPAILANAGVLKGFRATGFLPVREQIQKGGAKYTGTAVERDGLIITASDPSVTIPFAQTIIAVLKERQPKPDKAP